MARQKGSMKRGAVLTSLLWLVLVGTSVVFTSSQSKKQYSELAFQSGRSFFQQVVITREWGALHGGVYAPVTEITQPNPYLVTPLRDITVNEALSLTKINPSFMTRQISELTATKKGIQFHMSSLNPIRPQNYATEWEEDALKSFENGAIEKGQIREKNGEIDFIYMAPLISEKSCLQCHPDDREGDIRGGISVTLPITTKLSLLPLYFGHLLLGLTGLVANLIFWTKLSKAYEKIQRHALIDSLTGIANRRNFSERIVDEFKRSQRSGAPLSVIMCDIDNFKGYNDKYGHAEGDACLRKVAQSIEKSIKRPSDFCARYGGEEFVLILAETDTDGATQIAAKILQNVIDLHIPHDTSPPNNIVTLSIGISTLLDPHGKTYEDVIKQADAALYVSKGNGKNRFEIFEAEVNLSQG